uniref:Uncharacterized protein n=1 Tax=Anopheles coluzzii TaxID=1518534 RepID=A0A8W7PET0_ANOCL
MVHDVLDAHDLECLWFRVDSQAPFASLDLDRSWVQSAVESGKRFLGAHCCGLANVLSERWFWNGRKRVLPLLVNCSPAGAAFTRWPTVDWKEADAVTPRSYCDFDCVTEAVWLTNWFGSSLDGAGTSSLGGMYSSPRNGARVVVGGGK